MRYFNSKGMSFEKILFDLVKTGFPRENGFRVTNFDVTITMVTPSDKIKN